MKKVITLISIALSVSFMFISSKKKCDFFIYSELSLNSYSKKNDTFSITLYQTTEETWALVSMRLLYDMLEKC